jgi:glycine/D-amino acid oxidase-like deaminating enzyme
MAATAVAPSSYRQRSLWLDTVAPDDPLEPRPPLPGDLDVDVAIVGGGFTGLWTAYALRRADPSVRVAVLEAEICGFGASGRNGGWASALLPMSLHTIAARHGRVAAVALQRAMFDAVAEIRRVCHDEGIDCHYARDGSVHAATSPAHVHRLRDELDEARAFGLGDDALTWLDRRAAAALVDVPGLLGATFTPHCAAIHPARLVRGLARAAEARGARLFERTPVRAIEPGRCRTDHGTVRAATVVRATEAWTPTLPGQRRAVVPLYSLMVATEPLPGDVWDRIGWHGRVTFNDARNLIVYAQRTADGRIAFGGRGAPYHFGSAVRPAFDLDTRTHDALRATVRALFPAAADARFTHAWGGPLAVARDWHCSVGYDRAAGTAWAGGYVGDGVTTSHLAGRTLADLVLGRDTDLVRLPWVGHRSRRWEPEPLRWLGVNAVRGLAARLDRGEARTGRTPAAAALALRLLVGKG